MAPAVHSNIASTNASPLVFRQHGMQATIPPFIMSPLIPNNALTELQNDPKPTAVIITSETLHGDEVSLKAKPRQVRGQVQTCGDMVIIQGTRSALSVSATKRKVSPSTGALLAKAASELDLQAQGTKMVCLHQEEKPGSDEMQLVDEADGPVSLICFPTQPDAPDAVAALEKRQVRLDPSICTSLPRVMRARSRWSDGSGVN